MASELIVYPSAIKYMGNGVINLESDTFKIMLLTSAYTPNLAHTVLADINASPDPEIVPVASPDNGYTTGGETLTGVTWTNTVSPAQAIFDAANVLWTSLDATFRYGLIYALKTTTGSPAIVNPLLAYILFNTAPADVVVAGVDYEVRFTSNGLFTAAQSA